MKFASNRGFTLIEMVVTVAVMAILIGLSTPAIYEFMRQRDQQNEEIAQIEIRKAMQAYLADRGILPSDTATGTDAWYNQLAGYSSLSSNDIANDVWGRPRSYIVYLNNTRRLFGNTVNVYYATVHSMGLNGLADPSYINQSGASVSIPGLATTSSAGKLTFAGSTVTTWWKWLGADAQAKVDAFSALRPGGDDVMTRFTNYGEVLDRYNTTLMRMDKLTAALETYARSGYAERVSFCSTAAKTALLCDNGVPEYTVYYPKSSNDTTNTRYSNGTLNISNATNDVQRRQGMEALMNELGLPAEFCCSALSNGSDDLPLPFYYFSNPRPRTSSGCGTRPVHGQTHLPARMTTRNDNTTCG
ncbi:MAG: hypothetical protein DI585_02250 [Pseudomonas fluorescens]|nr:MAG: hypothetical protein DI585_02250 [Pseudomonas fluorescens]